MKNKNYNMLKILDPDLYNRLKDIDLPPDYQTMLARSGAVTARVKGVYMHSAYNPVAEAKKMGDFNQVHRAAISGIPLIIFGFGLGYHVRAILEKLNHVTVVEPDINIFALAFKSFDFTDVLPRINIIIEKDLPESLKKAVWIFHQPSVRLNTEDYIFWADVLKNEMDQGRKVSELIELFADERQIVELLKKFSDVDKITLDDIVGKIPSEKNGLLQPWEAIFLLMKEFEELLKKRQNGSRQLGHK